MPFSQKLLLIIPTALLGLIVVIIALAVATLGLLIVRRFISHKILQSHNDVAGFIFATLGVIYAVLLAFTVIIVWESFDKSNSNVQQEANYVMDICRDVSAFPPEFQSQVYSTLRQYVEIVIDEEWKSLAKGEYSKKAEKLVSRLWMLYSNYSPKTKTEQIFLQESVVKLNQFSEARNQRLLDSRNGLSPLLWFVLIMGGIITVTFTFFFGTENLKAQLIMTGLLTAIVALMMLTVLLFDFPFTGDIAVKPEAFEHILTFFQPYTNNLRRF